MESRVHIKHFKMNTLFNQRVGAGPGPNDPQREGKNLVSTRNMSSKYVSLAELDTICKSLTSRVHSDIPKAANDVLARKFFRELTKTLLDSMSKALKFVMRSSKGDVSTRRKGAAEKEVPMAVAAGFPIVKIREGLSDLIDGAIEFAVYDTWAEYVGAPLCKLVREVLGENGLAHRSKNMEYALEEYTVDDMSQSFVPQGLRDALCSRINKAMVEIAQAAMDDTPKVLPDALANVLLSEINTAVTYIIRTFTEGSLPPVADAVSAIVTELAKETLYGDVESIDVWARDRDGDVIMGGC